MQRKPMLIIAVAVLVAVLTVIVIVFGAANGWWSRGADPTPMPTPVPTPGTPSPTPTVAAPTPDLKDLQQALEGEGLERLLPLDEGEEMSPDFAEEVKRLELLIDESSLRHLDGPFFDVRAKDGNGDLWLIGVRVDEEGTKILYAEPWSPS